MAKSLDDPSLAHFLTWRVADAKVHAQMRKALEELGAIGSAGKETIRALLHDESPYVRSWIGAQWLSEGETDALPVLEKDATLPGLRGFACEMAIREYRKGRLKSPFGIPVT